MTKPLKDTQEQEMKNILINIHTNEYLENEKLIKTLCDISSLSHRKFKNSALEQYRVDLLRRANTLLSDTDFEEVKGFSTITLDYIRKNEERCANWAMIGLELTSLRGLAYKADSFCNLNLENSILEPDEDDDEEVAA